MSSIRAQVFQIFTSPQNRDYLKQYFPKIPDSEIDNNLDAFIRNYDDIYGNHINPWVLVRKLNRLFVENVNFNPSTATRYSSFGETIFMNEEVRI